MDLILLAKVLWRKKWILIFIPLLAASAAFLLTMNTEEEYRAVSQISTGYTLTDQVQLIDDKVNIRDADVKFNNLLNSMQSATPVNLVAYRLLLHDLQGEEAAFRRPDPEFVTTPEQKEKVTAVVKEKLQKFLPLATADPDYLLVRDYLSAYGYNYTAIRDNLVISRIPHTDFIQIEFFSDNPQVSAFAANAFCQEFIRYNESMKVERTGESVEFLRQVVNDKKSILDKKLETQKAFKSSNNLVNIQRDGESKLSQITELENLRDETRSKIHKWQLTIRRLKEEINNIASPGGGTIVNNQRMIDLRNKIARMNERFITTGSSNRVLLDSLEMLRAELQRENETSSRSVVTPGTGMSLPELKSQLSLAEIELQVEQSNLITYENRLQNVRSAFSGYASKEAALDAIQKEVDLASQEYLEAVNKYNEANKRLLSASTLRQVLVAAPPLNPEASKRWLLVGLAGVSSFVICLFVLVCLELIDVSVKTPDKFKRIVGLPLIGTLNKIDNKTFNIRNYFNQTTTSQEVEMYKSLLRKFRHEVENLNAKVLLFTSPKKRDGKTFTMFSLAYVLSLVNKRVLLIDTNFKNNSLSQLLVKPNSNVKLIEGRKIDLLLSAGKKTRANGEPEEADYEPDNTFDLINPTKYKNIFIVGNAGEGNESPAEILSGRDFSNLIAVLVDSFDYILLEGAALNDYSDTKELVKYADKVIAVFSAESSIKHLDQDSIAYFKSLGKKFGGSVLNKADMKDLVL